MVAAAVCGIVFTYEFQIERLFAAAALAACLFLLSGGRHSEGKKIFVLMIACFLAGGVLLSLEKADAERGVLAETSGSQAVLMGKVTEIQRISDDSYRICCSVSGRKLLLSFFHPLEDYKELMGCTISFSCTVEKPKRASNPRLFDYQLYLRSRRIYYTGTVDRIEKVREPVSLFDKAGNLIYAKRELFFEQASLSDTAEGLLRGVLFGDTKGLSEELYEDFRRNGTAHVLAVSGLHIGVLYGIYRSLYSRRKSAAVTAAFLLILFLYGTAALWSVSVTRAVVLIVLSLSADLLNRRYDFPTALAGAALVSIIHNPYVVFGVSFQMSFLAAASIAFFGPFIERKFSGGMAAAVSVQMGLLPYMAYTFNYVSLAGFFANIPVVFLVSVLVPLGIGGFFLFLFLNLIVPGFCAVAEGLGQMIVKVNGFFAGAGILSWDVVSPPLWLVVLIYGAAFFVSSEYFRVIFSRRNWKGLAAPGVILLCCLLFSAVTGASSFDKASAVFVDVGQGDCLHLKTERGQNLFIDGGGSIRYNIGEKTLKPYLLKNGAWKLDLAAATHLHTDHYLGLKQLAEVFPVKRQLLKGEAGQRISLGNGQWIDILWPVDSTIETEDENLNSMIFKVCMGGFSILVTGDITSEGEKMLLERYGGTGALSADILKVAHHGSPYSSSDAFIREVCPRAAVIGVGKNNYGHPSQKVIEKMEKSGIMVYRTDRDGAVGIIDKKGKISICTENP